MPRPEASGTGRALGVLLTLSATELQAQPVPPPHRLDLRIELEAHKALERVRRRPDVTLAPFTTDGCSGGLSQAWALVARTFPGFAEAHRRQPPWERCCVIHDRAYHAAGPDPAALQGLAARLAADEALRDCVQQTAAGREAELGAAYGMTGEQVRLAYDTIAAAMFLAVRFGGPPCTGLAWRWGYGYPDCD